MFKLAMILSQEVDEDQMDTTATERLLVDGDEVIEAVEELLRRAGLLEDDEALAVVERVVEDMDEPIPFPPVDLAQ